jgi:DNA polymerase-3 subunit delta'
VSAPSTDEEDEGAVPHPRATFDLYGHVAAEQALLDGYRSGRMPHAWLIGGAAGIGKATLAYRLARFVLAQPDPSAAVVQRANSLAVERDHPVARRIAAQGHGDLLVLRRTVGDTGKLRSVIVVDDVRRTIGFFGSTAGEGGWRVCIVDVADELNNNSANALLKIVEEPPKRCLLLLVSHAPGRLLPTIRSRCRRLALQPLTPGDLARSVLAATGRPADDPEVASAIAAAEGSVGRALTLLDGESLKLRAQIIGLLDKLPAVDPHAMHALGDQLAGVDIGRLTLFADAVRDWLSTRLRQPSQDLRRLAQVAEVWEKITDAARDVEIYNLERKPLVFSTFGLLADTARR